MNFCIIWKVAMELTDLDKLYLALAETGHDYAFNTLYYFLNITSIKALKEYKPTGNNNYAKFLQPNNINTMKYKICDKDFDFQKLALVRGKALLLNFSLCYYLYQLLTLS